MKALPYVKVEYQEAISGKRELLSAQADILKILKIIQIYKILRKKELLKKSKLKLVLNKLNKKIKNTLIELPGIESEIEKTSEIISTTNIQEISKSKSLDAELREIQAKLAELGEQ